MEKKPVKVLIDAHEQIGGEKALSKKAAVQLFCAAFGLSVSSEKFGKAGVKVEVFDGKNKVCMRKSYVAALRSAKKFVDWKGV